MEQEEEEVERWGGQGASRSLCIRYPAGEQEGFDALEASVFFQHTGRDEWVKLPAGFSTSAWSRLVMQVRPDGTISVFANGEFVREVDFRVPTQPPDRWRIRLVGASVGTHLYVASVVVWPGTRYQTPGT
jgi:hypothetical protein